MAICGCVLPAHCCQPAVAGVIIYADLWGELNIHLAPQALFTQNCPVCKPLLQAFPFPSTLGEVTLHPLFLACVFVYSSHGKWVLPLSCGVFLPPLLLQAFPLLIAGRVPLLLPASVFVYSSHGRWVFPPLLWSFPPSPTLTSFPTPGCWACAPTPARASLAMPGLFIYSSRKDSPPPLFGAQCTPPSLQRVFILIAYYSVSLFPQVEVGLSGGYADLAQGCLWEYCIPLSLPCLCLPKPSGHGQLAAWGPPWFLCLT
jgi:hypothetical protein